MTVEEDTGDIWVLDSHYQNLGATGSGLSEENPPRMLGLHFNDATQTVDELGAVARDAAAAPRRQPGPDLRHRHHERRQVLLLRRLEPPRLPLLRRTAPTCRPSARPRPVATTAASRSTRRPTASTSSTPSTPMSTCSAWTAATSARFGSEGEGPGQFAGGGRQIAVDDDDNVWVGDFGGFEAEKYTATGTPLSRHPSPRASHLPAILAQPRDVASRRRERRRLGRRRLGPAVPAVQLQPAPPRQPGASAGRVVRST